MKPSTQPTLSSASVNPRVETNNLQELGKEELQSVTGGLVITKRTDASSPLLMREC